MTTTNTFSRLFLLLLACLWVNSDYLHAQVQFWQDNFDAGSPTSGTRTPENSGGTGGPPFTSYFCMTPASGAVNQAVAFSGQTGNYWAGEDHNNPALSWAAVDGQNVREQRIDWTGINISGKSTLSMRVFLAANSTSDAWDNRNACLGGASTNTDYVIIQYRIDAGPFTDILHFFSKGAFTDKDLYEDSAYPVPDSCGEGTMLTNVFQEFTRSIPGTGTTLNLRLLVYSENNNEEWGIENIRMFEVVLDGEILEFTAQRESGAVNLSWKAPDQAPAYRYTIERSAGCGVYQPLADIQSEVGKQHYAWVDMDASVTGQAVCYRVSSFSVDGDQLNSEVVSLAEDLNTVSWNCFESPDAELMVAVTGQVNDATLEVMDMAGRLVHRNQIQGFNPVAAFQGLPRGVYLVRLIHGSQLLTHRVLISR